MIPSSRVGTWVSRVMVTDVTVTVRVSRDLFLSFFCVLASHMEHSVS